MDDNRAQIISSVVSIIAQCGCGDMFAITKTHDTVVCPGFQKAYRLAPLRMIAVNDEDYTAELLVEFLA